MSADHLDDDENVKAMRETARTIGLTQLLIDARQGEIEPVDAIRAALKLLGERSEYVEKPERV
jgi:hypothetical protein